MDIVEEAKKVFETEIVALDAMKEKIGPEFENILEQILRCKGKIIITGMGKPGHIAKKMAATFSSLGTPAFYLNPADAMHGDLGMISTDDVVIAISYSGESSEVVDILPIIHSIGAKIIAITANKNSSLAKNANYLQIMPKIQEACNLQLAPTSSTTMELCYGDALAVVASMKREFTEKDFARFHPHGSLGKKLTYTVEQIMYTGEMIPRVKINASLAYAIQEITRVSVGMVNIVDEKDRLLGILTDGDIRRLFDQHLNIYNINVEQVMNKEPYTAQKEDMVVEILQLFKEKGINVAPVVNQKNKVVGVISWYMITVAGVI